MYHLLGSTTRHHLPSLWPLLLLSRVCSSHQTAGQALPQVQDCGCFIEQGLPLSKIGPKRLESISVYRPLLNRQVVLVSEDVQDIEGNETT